MSTVESTNTAAPLRKVGLGLGAGILLAPYLFSWLLLRSGYSIRARVVGFGWLAIFVIGLAGAPRSHPQTTTTVASSQQESQPIKPVDNIVSDAEAVKQVEQRFKDEETLLKKYYASATQLKTASSDALLLAGIKGRYADGKTKEAKELSHAASTLLPRLQQQIRQIYASSLEEVFVKSGIDAKVSALGSEKKQLQIIYALMSQPLVYKFENEMRLDQQAKTWSFSTLAFGNGFEGALGKRWTVDLTK